MVNLKYFGLPLLVGLIYVGKATATDPCKITGANAAGSTPTNCSTADDGYHVLFANGEATEGTLITLNSGTSVADADLKDKIGYFKSGTSNRFISCYDNTGVKCKYIDKPTTTCSENTIGQLVAIGNVISICLAKYSTVENPASLTFASDDDANYLVEHTLAGISNTSVFVHVKTANYYTIKRTENAFYLDDTVNNDDTDFKCVSADNSKIVDRREDFCNPKSSGLYIVCTSGVCDSYKQSSPDIKEINEESECIKSEKYIISYQMIGNKMYKISSDAVVQRFDGYYFVNGNHRAINAKEDYSNPDTVGYMCSVSGECYEIDPDDVKYYKDYVTEEDGQFTVVKYDPEKKTKRQEEGSSGYEVITEEGIFKLDDGSYVECEMEKNGEISCKDIDHEGSMMTNDNELLLCVKNDKKEVECTQATKGGYYMVNDELLECEVNEDGEKLDCDVVQKEGYFLGDGQNILYKCVENVPEEDEDDDKLGVSNLDSGLLNVDGYIENTDNIKENEENGEDSLDVELIRRRKRQEENDSNVSTTNATETGDKPTETITAETGTSTIMESSTPIPVDVVCKPEECTPERIINNGSTENPVDLYVCKKVEKMVETEPENSDETKPKDDDNDDENEKEDEDIEEEEEKVQWIAKNCDSGNFRKEKENYYNCEDEKEGMDESKIPKPNTDHTSTEKTGSPKTKTTKSMESSTTPVEEVTTTTTVNTFSETTTSSSSASSTKTKTTDEKQTKTPKKTSTITTTTKTTTTTTTKATNTTTAPSGAIPMKSIPSMAFYILLFVMFAFIYF